MYKLTIKDKQYHFFKHYPMGYVKVCATSDQIKLTDYIETELKDTKQFVRNNLGVCLAEALKDMLSLNNNAAEFGLNGYYTVSYRE